MAPPPPFFTIIQSGGLVAAGIIGLLAVYLLVLEWRNRAHRAFAFLLAVQAAAIAAKAFAIGLRADSMAFHTEVYYDIALPFAALYGAYVYRRRYSPSQAFLLRNRFVVPVLLVAGGVLLEFLYFRDHALVARIVEGPPSYLVAGPLHLVPPVTDLIFVGLAARAARDALANPNRVKRRALLLASLGFSLSVMFSSGFAASNGLLNTALHGLPLLEPVGANGFWYYLATLLDFVPFLLLIALGLGVAVAGRRAGSEIRREARLYAGTLAAPLVVAILAAVWFQVQDALGGSIFVPIIVVNLADDVWALSLGVVVTYALVRHHVFDVDVRIVYALSWGFAGACLLAVFFVASGVVQTMLGNMGGIGNLGGPIVGGVVSGLFLFALLPVERVAHKMFARAMPGARKFEHPSDADKVSLYREQVQLAWVDGQLTRKEHTLLQALRQRLGLSAEQAASLESEAAKAVA